MRVVITNAISYQSKTPEKFLETVELENNQKKLAAFLNERQHLTPFIASVGGLLGVEAEATLKRIASRIAHKWQ